MRTHYNVLIPHELVDMTDDTTLRAAPSTTRAVANGHDYRLRVNDSCQRMDSNAAANYADDNNDRSSHQQPQQQLYKPSMVVCNANTPPIPSNRTAMTASPSPHTATSPRPPPPYPLPSGATTGESITTRQQQLERMVANLISRLEEVFSEDNCDDDDDDDDVHDDDDDGMQHYHYLTTDMTTGRHIRT